MCRTRPATDTHIRFNRIAFDTTIGVSGGARETAARTHIHTTRCDATRLNINKCLFFHKWFCMEAVYEAEHGQFRESRFEWMEDTLARAVWKSVTLRRLLLTRRHGEKERDQQTWHNMTCNTERDITRHVACSIVSCHLLLLTEHVVSANKRPWRCIQNENWEWYIISLILAHLHNVKDTFHLYKYNTFIITAAEQNWRGACNKRTISKIPNYYSCVCGAYQFCFVCNHINTHTSHPIMRYTHENTS